MLVTVGARSSPAIDAAETRPVVSRKMKAPCCPLSQFLAMTGPLDVEGSEQPRLLDTPLALAMCVTSGIHQPASPACKMGTSATRPPGVAAHGAGLASLVLTAAAEPVANALVRTIAANASTALSIGCMQDTFTGAGTA